MKRKCILIRTIAYVLSAVLLAGSMPAGVVFAENSWEENFEAEMNSEIELEDDEKIEKSSEDEIGKNELNENTERISEVDISEEESEENRTEIASEETSENASENTSENTSEDSTDSPFEIREFVPNLRNDEEHLDPIVFADERMDYRAFAFYNSEEELTKAVENNSYYDSRNENIVTPVRNQNPYGSCWAHAAIAGSEINAIKKGLYTNPATMDLSETHLAYFTYNAVTDPLGLSAGDALIPNYESEPILFYRNYLSYGGSANYGASSLMNWLGPVEESVAPYPSGNNTIADIDEKYAYGYDAYHLRGFYKAAMSDIDAVKRLIVDYGAVASAYKHNVAYYTEDCSYFYSETGTGTNHAITIVGWDDHYSKDRFEGVLGEKPSKDGAWIVKNSYGDDWGNQNGYFYLSYYEGTLFNTATAVAYDVDSKDNYDNNYHYDGAPSSGNTSWTVETEYFTVFTASAYRKERVKAVAVNFAQTGTPYTLNIYKNTVAPGSTGITSMGEKVYSCSGTVDFAGYYTFDIPEEYQFNVKEGESYAVSVVLPARYKMAYVDSKALNSYTFVNQVSNACYYRHKGYQEINQYTKLDYCMKAYTDNVTDLNLSLKSSTEAVDFNTPAVDHLAFYAFPGALKYSFMVKGKGDASFSEYKVFDEDGSGSYDVDYSVGLKTPYSYYVEALNSEGEIIACSDVITGIEKNAFTFDSLQAEVKDKKTISITWNGIQNAEGYEILCSWKEGADAKSQTIQVEETGLTSYEKTIPGICGIEYVISIKAIKGEWEVCSEELKVLIPADDIGFVLVRSSSAVDFDTPAKDVLRWMRMDDVSSYRLMCYSPGSETARVLTTLEIPEDKKTYSLGVNISDGNVPRRYYVECLDAQGNLLYCSQIVTGISDASFAIEAPTLKWLGEVQVEANWNGVPGAKGYRFHYSQTNGGENGDEGEITSLAVAGQENYSAIFTPKPGAIYRCSIVAYKNSWTVESTEAFVAGFGDHVIADSLVLCTEDGRKINGGFSLPYQKGEKRIITANAYDFYGNEIDLSMNEGFGLNWSVNNTTAATIRSLGGNQAELTINEPSNIKVKVTTLDGGFSQAQSMVIVALPEVKIEHKNLNLNLAKTVKETEEFEIQTSYGMEVQKVSISSLKKGQNTQSVDGLSVVEKEGKYYLHMDNSKVLSTGSYQLELSIQTDGLSFQDVKPEILVKPEDTQSFRKTIELKVINTKPVIECKDTKMNLFLPDTYEQILDATSKMGEITDIQAVPDQDNGFEQYFTFSQKEENWVVSLNPKPNSQTEEYHKTSCKGKVLFYVDGFAEPIKKEVRILTPTKKPDIKQGKVPVIQVIRKENGEVSTDLSKADIKLVLGNGKAELTDVTLSGNGLKVSVNEENQFVLKEGFRYKNGEILSLKLNVSKGEWAKDIQIPVKVKVSERNPKLVLKTSEVKLNSNLDGEIIWIPMDVNRANVEINSVEQWTVKQYNPQSKIFEKSGIHFADNQKLYTKNFVFQYDQSNGQMGVSLRGATGISQGTYKIRLFVLSGNYENLYKEIKITVTNKAPSVSVGTKGKINLLARNATQGILTIKGKNTNALAKQIQVVDRNGESFSQYFYTVLNESTGQFEIKAYPDANLVASEYRVPVEVTLSGNVTLDGYVKVKTTLNAPKMKKIQDIALSKKYSTTGKTIDFDTLIDDQYGIKSVEVVGGNDELLSTQTDGAKLSVKLKDLAAKNGRYSVKVQITFEGDSYNNKPVYKKIYINVLN